MTRLFLNLTVLFLIFVLLYQFATRSAPTGGPVDRIPPFVVSTEPKSDTTGVRSLSEIKIEFSERMNEGSLSKALFISPPLDYELKWKRGRHLRLEISDTLKPDQTYVVSIGSETSDSRNNKMDRSYQFAFSTGDRIDQGGIGGTVFGRERNQTATLFAFLMTEDTVYFDKKPDYLSQSGTDGNFEFNYLKWGRYRIFAVVDQNNNLQMDIDYERIGIPFADVEIDSMRSHFRGLNMQLTRIDTLAPEVLSVRAIHNRYLQLRLSEPVITPDISGFQLRDSLLAEPVRMLAIAPNRENANTLDLFTMPFDTSVYELVVPVFHDSAGNESAGRQVLSFPGALKEDTTHFKILSAEPADSSTNFHPEHSLYLEFSNPVDWDSLPAWFSLSSKGGIRQEGTWRRNSAFDARFFPEAPLIPDTSYVFSLQVSQVQDVWNNTLEDSLFSRYFTITPEREMGEIGGVIEAPGHPSKPISLTIAAMRRGGLKVKMRLDRAGAFTKHFLPEGLYRLNGFVDLDEDGAYSPGDLFPFSHSEPYAVYPDTINVRKRWETSGVNLVFPSAEGTR
jgi:hypothetical protein